LNIHDDRGTTMSSKGVVELLTDRFRGSANALPADVRIDGDFEAYWQRQGGPRTTPRPALRA